MERLGDFDVEIADPDPGFLLEGTAAPLVSGRLFVVVGNRTAYRVADCGEPVLSSSAKSCLGDSERSLMSSST